MTKRVETSKTGILQRATPRVAVVVLNWNRWKDTIECLESLSRIDYPNYNIIVVDNASKDESIKKIREYTHGKIEVKSKYFEECTGKKPMRVVEYARKEIGRITMKDGILTTLQEGIIVIRNERNYGYAEGNNIAIRFALRCLKSDYVLIVNNDVVVDKSFLERLIEVAEGDRRIGIVGPKMYYYDFSGRSDVIDFGGEDIVLWQAKGIRYGFNEVDKGQHERIREVDKIDGACLLIKKSVLDDIGLFDPALLMYWEETDLCIRAKKGGYRIMYVPKSRIWHKIAVSIGGSSAPEREYLMTRNRFIFVRKNASLNEKVGFLVYFFLLNFWANGFSLMKRNDIKLFASYARGAIDGLRALIGGVKFKKHMTITRGS